MVSDDWQDSLEEQVKQWRLQLQQRRFDLRRWDRILRIAEKRELKAGRIKDARRQAQNGTVQVIDYNANGANEAKQQVAQAEWDIELLEVSIAEAEAELAVDDGSDA